MNPIAVAVAVAVVVGGAAQPAFASPYTEIASALDEDDPFDLHVSVAYELDARRSTIKREIVGQDPGTGPNDPVPIAKDLLFSGIRHTIVPTVQVGVFTDLEISLALPIIVSDSYTLGFDQRTQPCVFPGNPSNPTPTCINADNSSTTTDGLLPTTGFDAGDPSGPGFTNPADDTIFRGTTRKGLDQLRLGVTWAPMNQRRDPTKPTWKVGTELRIAVGSAKKFDRVNPDRETSVGQGFSQVRLWTSMAKRIAWAEPYVELWWMAPFAVDDEVFVTPGFGEQRTSPQQLAAAEFGFEAVVWERPEAKQRVSFEFTTRLRANFEGRAYTEMWEVFAYAGDETGGGPLILDSDPVTAGLQPLSHPGVSNVENFMTFGGRFGIHTVLGERVRFGASFELQNEQSHLLTIADAGIDRPGCAAGATANCESPDNDVIDPGTTEVNPLHSPVIDVTGHRYRVDEVTQYQLLITGMVLF